MENQETVAGEQPDESDPNFSEALGNFKGEINIEVIDGLNVMVIRGNERDVEQILKVIRQIEQLSEATGVWRFICCI